MRGSRGGGGGAGKSGPPRLKNHKNIGFLSKIGQDSPKNRKAAKPAFKPWGGGGGGGGVTTYM